MLHICKRNVNFDVENSLKTKKPPTHSFPSGKKALEVLQEDDDIVIKKADKRGAIGVWGEDIHVREVLHQLKNTEFY